MPGEATGAQLRRFLVTWRDGQELPAIHDVGCLSFDGSFRFHYLDAARTAPGFHPLPGLPDLTGVYGPAADLFPVFAGRVMERSRPDFASYVAALDLPRDAGDLDILARSGGVSRGDHLALTEEPTIHSDGTTGCTFLVRGLRFALPDPEVREQVLAALTGGTRLAVRDDPANDVSADALLLCTSDGVAVGWVPDALTGFVRRVVEEPAGSVTVQRRNSPAQPPHARLLVHVAGRLTPGAVTLPSLGVRPGALAAV